MHADARPIEPMGHHERREGCLRAETRGTQRSEPELGKSRRDGFAQAFQNLWYCRRCIFFPLIFKRYVAAIDGRAEDAHDAREIRRFEGRAIRDAEFRFRVGRNRHRRSQLNVLVRVGNEIARIETKYTFSEIR